LAPPGDAGTLSSSARAEPDSASAAAAVTSQDVQRMKVVLFNSDKSDDRL
jgi:hypothetical protein